jgi:hypothetical protein
MKKYMFMPLICLALMSSTCQKDDDDSHFYITIKNQSDSDVYICLLFTNFEGGCSLDNGDSALEKNSVLEFHPYNFSIERELGSGSKSVLELYFVNPNQYNEQGIFYDCDSIPVKNDVLKHYRLTLEDLKQCNFTITYP